MFISIVIPTHNRPHFLEQCLRPLAEQLTGAGDAEVQVVDDGSSPEAAEENRSLCALYKVNYYRCEKNRGMAVARNLGIERVTGVWVVFIDDDFRVADDWFATLVRVLHAQDDSVAGVEGRIEGIGEGLWDREVQNLSGGLFLTCHIAFRKSTLDAIGRFDPQFEFNGPFCEDHELAVRALRYGVIVFAPELSGVHLPRRIRLLSYLRSSFKRVRGLLYAEYYFFYKQQDWYHRFRHSRTFWGTYFSIVIRNVLTTLRRRRFVDCMRHPVQFLTLILASHLEQVGAWLLLPHFIRALLRDRSCFFHTYIDERRTEALWRLRPGNAIVKLRFSYAPFHSLFFPLLKNPVYDVRIMLKKMETFIDLTNCKVLLRVDDVFLYESVAVNRFIEVMNRKRFPFLAGVTGDDLINPGYHPTIARLRESGAEIGIHGFTHEGRFGPFASEILQMKYPELSRRIALIASAPVFSGTPPRAFMPPFNAIAGEQISFLSKIFDIVTGGPETMRFSDRFAGPAALRGGGWYVPTTHPFYGPVRDFPLAQLRRLKGFISISVHLTEETKDNFKAFEHFLDSLPAPPISWNIFTKDNAGGGE
jgi:glycosyltransferase involved in cell wall biosynthesis